LIQNIALAAIQVVVVLLKSMIILIDCRDMLHAVFEFKLIAMLPQPINGRVSEYEFIAEVSQSVDIK
jgi:hypothetical protein